MGSPFFLPPGQIRSSGLSSNTFYSFNSIFFIQCILILFYPLQTPPRTISPYPPNTLSLSLPLLPEHKNKNQNKQAKDKKVSKQSKNKQQQKEFILWWPPILYWPALNKVIKLRFSFCKWISKGKDSIIFKNKKNQLGCNIIYPQIPRNRNSKPFNLKCYKNMN